MVGIDGDYYGLLIVLQGVINHYCSEWASPKVIFPCLSLGFDMTAACRVM